MARVIYGIMSENGTQLQTHNLETGGVVNDGDMLSINPTDYTIVDENFEIGGKLYSKIELLNDSIALGDGTVSQRPPCQSVVLTETIDGKFQYAEITT